MYLYRDDLSISISKIVYTALGTLYTTYTTDMIVEYVLYMLEDRFDGYDRDVCANLGIKLGTRSQVVTTISENQNTGQTMGSGTQGSGLTFSSSIGKYLTKYR